MTDTSQGQGWWLASDGKWYPPELHPDVASTATLSDPTTTKEELAAASGPQGSGWWLASDGKWYAPEYHPDAGREWGDDESAPLTHGDEGERDLQPPRRRGPVLALVGILVVIAIVVSFVATRENKSPTSTHATATTAAIVSKPWTLSGLDVVGGPVISGNTLLVMSARSDKTLSLQAIDARDGKAMWELPYSPSEINPGVVINPLVEGNIVMDLAPASAQLSSPSPASSGSVSSTSSTSALSSSLVSVEGVDLATGRVVWSTGSTRVTDAPTVCTVHRLFCVNESNPDGSTLLVEIEPTAGTVTATIAGLYRQMTTNLYMNDQSESSLVLLADSGQSAWSVLVSALFGSAQYSPSYGHNFATSAQVVVGSVGVSSTGSTIPVASLKTVGVDVNSGKLLWSDPGAFQCFNSLGLPGQFICKYAGFAKVTQGTISTSQASLTLEGFDPASGKVSWTQAVSNVQAMTTGTGVPIADDQHIVVQTGSETGTLIDLQTGATATALAGPYWCAQSQTVSLNAPAQALSNGVRSASSLFAPCTASGSPASTTPTTHPSSVGVMAGSLFIWASPSGLQAIAAGT